MKILKRLAAHLLGFIFLGAVIESENVAAGTESDTGNTPSAYISVSNKNNTFSVFNTDGIASGQDKKTLKQYKKSDVVYEKDSNTLTLQGCDLKNITACGMGDDFCIRLEGDNIVTEVEICRGSVCFLGNGKLTSGAICLKAQGMDVEFTVSDKASVRIDPSSADRDSSGFRVLDTKNGTGAIRADADRKIETVVIPCIGTESVELPDGSYEYYPTVTKDGSRYYVKAGSTFSKGVLAVTKYDVYSLIENRLKTVATFASEKDLKEAGYSFESESSIFSYSYGDSDAITFTPQNKDSEEKRETVIIDENEGPPKSADFSVQGVVRPGRPVVYAGRGKDGTSVRLSVSATYGAQGYRVYMKSSGDSGYRYVGTIAEDGTRVRTYTKKNLVNGEYSFKVRAFTSTDGTVTYGSWSKAVFVVF